MSRIDALLRVLGMSVVRLHKPEKARFDDRYLAAALDRMDRAIVVIDSEFVCQFVNERASRIAERRDAIEIGERVTILQRAIHDRVVAFLRRSESAKGCNQAECVYRCALPRSTGERDYLVSIRALPDSSRMPLPAYFIVEIHDPSLNSVDPDCLRDLFGLTPTEATVVAGLFSSGDVGELSQRLGVSENTVRAHIRAAYAKCEVHSLSQLIQLVALGPR